MKLSKSKPLCAAIALATALATMGSAASAPLVPPKAPEATPQVLRVQEDAWRRLLRDNDRNFDRRDLERHWDRDRRGNRGWDRDRDRDHFERRAGSRHWRGHRGFRDRRPGYRYHDGWWFPPAAFALGAIIGGTMSQQAVRPSGNAHVQWCYDRWRSYRASDNTYQPNNGPRRQCVSPYSR
ncbi:BA14K family protein [Chelativorans sp.]|uniref:BA14K family protein n=1 Tax=Chelativorans sp. TaxID=2203393 RepID=UPI002811D4C3|nr:BA14K family protein [Chelativorans sp.]